MADTPTHPRSSNGQWRARRRLGRVAGGGAGVVHVNHPQPTPRGPVSGAAAAAPAPAGLLLLRLYVSGDGARARRAIMAVEAIAAEIGPGSCALEIVDVLADPARAEEDRVIATPTLVKRAPEPRTKLVGDLSNPAVVAERLGIGRLDGGRP